jgi:hypothetical protein
VPGCTSYRNLHDHHIHYRSAGGSDDLSNRGRAPDALRFELPLATYGPGERLVSV